MCVLVVQGHARNLCHEWYQATALPPDRTACTEEPQKNWDAPRNAHLSHMQGCPKVREGGAGSKLGAAGRPTRQAVLGWPPMPACWPPVSAAGEVAASHRARSREEEAHE